MIRTVALAAILAVAPTALMAADSPDLLKRKFATDPAACKAEAGADDADALTLDKTGIYGVEFSCSFLDFWPHLGSDGKIADVVVLASCGDDSGITRPDLITIVPQSPEELQVQSQNEYVQTEVAASLAPAPADNGGDNANAEDDNVPSFDYVTATYTLCK